MCYAVGFSRSCGCASGFGMLTNLPRSACCTFSSTSVGCAALGTDYDSLRGVAGTPLPFWFFLLCLWPRSLREDYFFGGFLVGAVRLGLWRTSSLLGAFVHVMLCF